MRNSNTEKLPVALSDYQTIPARAMMENLEMELSLMAILEDLETTPELRLRFSRTMSAISADLGIAQEKPGSGHILDIAPGETGGDSRGGQKCLMQEPDS